MATIRKRGSRWQAIVRIKKDGAIIHQESETFSTEKLARSWAEKVEARIKLDGVQARSGVTLAELIEEYTKALEEVKPLRRSRAGELAQLAALPLSRKKVTELTTDMFASFARERYKEVTATTVLHNLSTFQSVLGAAKPLMGIQVSSDVVGRAIATLRKTGHVANSKWRDRRLEADEEQRLLDEFKRVSAYPDTIIPMEKIMSLAIALPRRREEITKMRWDDIDSAHHTILLRETKHPTKVRDELVPIPSTAWEIIQSMPRIDECIFPFRPESISRSFARATERLGIINLTFHDMRHEGVSRLFELGLDIPEVAILSGHSWSVLRRYTHLRPKRVLEKLNARIKEAQEARAESEESRADHVDHPDG